MNTHGVRVRMQHRATAVPQGDPGQGPRPGGVLAFWVFPRRLDPPPQDLEAVQTETHTHTQRHGHITQFPELDKRHRRTHAVGAGRGLSPCPTCEQRDTRLGAPVTCSPPASPRPSFQQPWQVGG